MQIHVLQENLQVAFQDIAKAISSRPSLPILGCIFLEANQEKQAITLSATDLHIGIHLSLPGKVTIGGKAAIPAKILMELIATFSPGEIEFRLQQGKVDIRSSSSKAQLLCLPVEDFPLFPEKSGQAIELSFEAFATAVQSTGFAASVDESRPVLTSLLFSLGETMEVVSTDGFRLSRVVTPISLPAQRLLLPAKSVQEVVKIALRKKIDRFQFTVSEKLKQAFFSFEGIEVLVRLMEGEFPPYQKILPADFQTEIVFDATEFSQKLKTALIFSRDSAGIITFKISDKDLTLISASSTLGSQTSVIPIQVKKGGNQEIAFHARYITDFLQVLKPDTLWFGMNESLKPAMFRPEGAVGFEYVVMPFRVNQ